jgi:hypothetical protein
MTGWGICVRAKVKTYGYDWGGGKWALGILPTQAEMVVVLLGGWYRVASAFGRYSADQLR